MRTILLIILILLLIGLPIADQFNRPAFLRLHPEPGQKYYSYEAAKKNPAAFALWWGQIQEQYRLLQHDIMRIEVNSPVPFHLRAGTHGSLFQSHISINSLGFRGKEISREKGNAYRIVALGESTDFRVHAQS